MKKVLLVIFLFTMIMAAGYHEYNTKSLFYSRYSLTTTTLPQDSISRSSSGYYTINTVATVADSITTGTIYKSGGVSCTQTFYVGTDECSGTPNVLVYYGIYRGAEAGWLWTQVGTITSVGSVVTIDINDSAILSFGTNRIANNWGIKLKESGTQHNKLWVHAYEWWE